MLSGNGDFHMGEILSPGDSVSRGEEASSERKIKGKIGGGRRKDGFKGPSSEHYPWTREKAAPTESEGGAYLQGGRLDIEEVNTKEGGGSKSSRRRGKLFSQFLGGVFTNL